MISSDFDFKYVFISSIIAQRSSIANVIIIECDAFIYRRLHFQEGLNRLRCLPFRLTARNLCSLRARVILKRSEKSVYIDPVRSMSKNLLNIIRPADTFPHR